MAKADKSKIKVMYLDESGDHNLIKINSDYPVFVLGGIIVDFEYAKNEFERKINSFKLDMFGTTEIILHAADIIRNCNGFEQLTDSSIRKRFYKGLNSLMSELDYSVIACAIQKNEFVEHQENYLLAGDPYFLCLNSLTERFCKFLIEKNEFGLIFAERRSQDLDRKLDFSWEYLMLQGLPAMKSKLIKQRILSRKLNLSGKKENIAGLQIADLVVSPIGRHLIGKPEKNDWKIVKQKLLGAPDEKNEGVGLVVLPKK